MRVFKPSFEIVTEGLAGCRAVVAEHVREQPHRSLDQSHRRDLAPGHDEVTERYLLVDEAAHTLEQLNSVFGLIEELRAVDTTGIEPMTHAQDMTLRLRADQVTETDQRAACQQAAPSVEQGLYLVPRVIE